MARRDANGKTPTKKQRKSYNPFNVGYIPEEQGESDPEDESSYKIPTPPKGRSGIRRPASSKK